MGPRYPTEPERRGLMSLRDEQLKASYAAGLPKYVAWLVAAVGLGLVVAAVVATLD